MRNTDSKPPKAHFCPIHSPQFIPANISTREFAGETTGSKGLGLYTAHLYEGCFTLSKNMSGGVTKWISAHYGMFILGLFREVFKDFAEAGKMPDWPPQRPAFPH